MIRGQVKEFCGRSAETRKRYCLPGGRLDDILETVDTVSEEANRNTMYVIHAGTNDISSTRPADLLEKYKRVIRKFKGKSRHVLVSEILPRMTREEDSHKSSLNDAALRVNTGLKNLCRAEGVELISTWDHFNKQQHLYNDDGLHLNGVGAARFGRLLNEAVILHSKNFLRGGFRAGP